MNFFRQAQIPNFPWCPASVVSNWLRHGIHAGPQRLHNLALVICRCHRDFVPAQCCEKILQMSNPETQSCRCHGPTDGIKTQKAMTNRGSDIRNLASFFNSNTPHASWQSISSQQPLNCFWRVQHEHYSLKWSQRILNSVHLVFILQTQAAKQFWK